MTRAPSPDIKREIVRVISHEPSTSAIRALTSPRKTSSLDEEATSRAHDATACSILSIACSNARLCSRAPSRALRDSAKDADTAPARERRTIAARSAASRPIVSKKEPMGATTLTGKRPSVSGCSSIVMIGTSPRPRRCASAPRSARISSAAPAGTRFSTIATRRPRLAASSRCFHATASA